MSFGSSVVAAFNRARRIGGWVHPGLLDTLARVLAIVGFILDRWIRSRALYGSLGSLGVVGFSRVHFRRGRDHPGSLGSLRRDQVVVVFIHGRWVH